jgi:hypothetical protein
MTGSADAQPLPPILAAQVALIHDQLTADAVITPDALRTVLDAAVLTICEHVEVDMGVLNRVLGVRAAVEGFALTLEDPHPDADAITAAWGRARDEVAALEAGLAQARPSAITVARGLGW